MSDTWLTLQLARDAWDSGHLRESWQLMDRVEVDFEYVGLALVRRTPRFELRWIDLLEWQARYWFPRTTKEWAEVLARAGITLPAHLMAWECQESDGPLTRIAAVDREHGVIRLASAVAGPTLRPGARVVAVEMASDHIHIEYEEP